jgi:indole-3-glycerol phosphate synthase
LNDFLVELAEDAKRRVAEGYYKVSGGRAVSKQSITEALLSCKRVSVIAEIKFASPSQGIIRQRGDVEEIARAMENGGAVALSVLTEPKHFNGSIEKFIQAKEAVKIPVLMKDIIVSPKQLDAACKIGADCILLVKSLFDRGLCELKLHQMIEYAQSKELDVLVETHTDEEFSAALNLSTDLVGINNRDLSTLKVDISVTEKILEQHNPVEKMVISESGIKTPDDIRLLHGLGVRGFLIGSEIMHSENIEDKVREFVMALD